MTTETFSSDREAIMGDVTSAAVNATVNAMLSNASEGRSPTLPASNVEFTTAM